MKRNLWLVIGYHDTAGYPYDHKTRGLGIPLGVYSTEELAREVGEAYARDEEGTFIGPRSGLEQAIAAIWERVLSVKSPGVNDNFFDLGGHSLLLVQVQNKIREDLGIDLQFVNYR